MNKSRIPRSRRKRPTGPLFYALKPHHEIFPAHLREMEYRHLSAQGSFEVHHQLHSRYLQPTQTVIIYLPPGYWKHPDQRFPVLYAHDGNNLFDPATAFMGREWRLDETLEHLFAHGRLPELIVVGIYNTPERFEDYTWHTSIYNGYPCGGRGPAFARFVVEELKPWIDGHYRTLPAAQFNGLLGSSLGALSSFYIAMAYPHHFSRLALMSPTVYWAQHQILKDSLHFPRGFQIWIDIGTEEGHDPETEETVTSTQALVQALEARGYERNQNLVYYIDWFAGHDEIAWGKRVEKPLQFLFGKLNTQSET
jgi:predicted alpha/beta superfamily hydrolase